MIKSKHILNILGLFIMSLLLLCGGCAETVTDKTLRSPEVQFEITLKTPPNFTAYDYLIILSNSNALNVDTTSPNFYLFTPGRPVDKNPDPIGTPAINFMTYYSTYFSTWTDYIVFNTINPQLYKGAFSKNTATKAAHDAYTASTSFNPNNNTSNNTLRFTFSTEYLHHNTNQLYFTIITSKKNDGTDEVGNIQDHLNSIKSIQIESGRQETGIHINTGAPNSAADITHWKVSIL